MLPIFYAVPAYAAIWATGLGGVPNPTFLERARLTLMVVTTGTIMAWLRMKSGYLTGECGIARIPFTSLIAWHVWRLAGAGNGVVRTGMDRA